MKKNETKIIATWAEAHSGKAFTDVDKATLPPFCEADYHLTEDDKRYSLVNRLRHIAFPTLPLECRIENYYSGILATDLFSLNTLLGSMIENRVVQFLNAHRHLWDDGTWIEYYFIRSNESFPDVRLVRQGTRNDIVLGIELKSWFVLSKEGEPSFRYRTSSDACDKGDLLCIIPWYLSDAVCGNPVLGIPWVYSAKAAAEATKRYWMYERNTEHAMTLEQRGLEVPKNVKPYMENARDKTNYKPMNDAGNNFGRLSRTGIMSEFVNEILMTDILGIPADNWRLFLQAHTDSRSLQDIQKKIGNIIKIPKSYEFKRIIKSLSDYMENLPNV